MVISAHDLSSSECGGFNDPYIRLQLSPAVDNRKRQTAINRQDSNPYFDQTFKFPVSHDDLQEKTLVVQVIKTRFVDGEKISSYFEVGPS